MYYNKYQATANPDIVNAVENRRKKMMTESDDETETIPPPPCGITMPPQVKPRKKHNKPLDLNRSNGQIISPAPLKSPIPLTYSTYSMSQLNKLLDDLNNKIQIQELNLMEMKQDVTKITNIINSGSLS